MSHSSIARAAADPQLQARVQSAIWREITYNQDKADSDFGQAMIRGIMNLSGIYWQVAVSTEAAYESALLAGRGAPGHDSDIITDAALTSAVSAAWPPDTMIVPPPTP